MSAVTLPRLEDPDVSVVIALGDGSEAKRAVSALADSTEQSFELILVANREAAGRIEEEVEGATIVRSETGTSLAAAHNQGARLARGRALCFLNADVLVEPGWLPPLLETLAEPGVGAAAPLVLNDGGTVREAGWIVDSIGNALPVGVGGDPRSGELRFRREVDFGSAACLLVRAEAFHELEGFDEQLSPLADADLCFRLRERGLRTIYVPRARITGRVAPSSGRSEFFPERWGKLLARRPRVIDAARKPHRMLAARDAEALERFLVVAERATSPRLSTLLSELAALWPWSRITLVAGTVPAEREVERLLRQGIEIACPPVDWERWFAERRFHYGVLLVCGEPGAERFGRYLGRSQPQAMRIFDTEALMFRRLEHLAELLPQRKQQREARAKAARTRESEIRAIQEADVVFVISEEEARFVAEIAPETTAFVLPGIAEPLFDPPGFEERGDLLFSGDFLAGPASPSADSLAYLVQDVLPLFWESHPAVGLNVIGGGIDEAVRAHEGPRVRIVGEVEDQAGWLGRARLHVNPLRYGGGPEQGFLNSLAAGLPFVTTSVGAESLPLGDLRNSLVADSPVRLASLISGLYDDRSEWERARARLLELGGTCFDRGSFERTLLEAMTHVGLASRPLVSSGGSAEPCHTSLPMSERLHGSPATASADLRP